MNSNNIRFLNGGFKTVSHRYIFIFSYKIYFILFYIILYLLQVGASHHRVVQLMGEAALRGQVTMILRRRSRQVMRYPYDVIVSRNENEGFGFVVISSSNQYYGSTIG